MGKLESVSGTLANTIGELNPFRYRGYYYDTECGLYYLQSRYYDPMTSRFINADTITDGNAMHGNDLFMYSANNPVNNSDPLGKWSIKNAIQKSIKNSLKKLVKNLTDPYIASIDYSFKATANANPQKAYMINSANPVKNYNTSSESKAFVGFIAKNDIVADASVSVSIPLTPAYAKVGVSKFISARKNIEATYLHAGGGFSTPSLLPITFSGSLGIAKNVNNPADYAGPFVDLGGGHTFGYDYCFWPGGSSAYSFTAATNYGMYLGYDYYWYMGG